MYVYIYVGIDKLSTVESVQQWAPSKSLVMGERDSVSYKIKLDLKLRTSVL